jgi:hypothetical protein
VTGNHEAHYVADRVVEWPEEPPAAAADPQTRHEVSRLGGGAIIGVDSCHGQEAAPVSAAWVSDRIGAVVTRPA